MRRPCASQTHGPDSAYVRRSGSSSEGVIRQSSNLSLLLLTATALTAGSLLMLCPASAHAQGGVPLWTNRYDGPPAGSASPTAIAVNSRDNVFVTGESWNGSNSDYATLGYSSAGEPLWTNFYNGPGNGDDVPSAIAVDNSGNVFVTGGSWNGSSQDYATIAYSNAGVPLWTNRYNGPANTTDFADAIAVDSSSNVFVSGIGPTIKYSSAGVPIPG